MVQMTQSFPDTLSFAPPTPRPTDWPLVAILTVWVCGFVVIALIRFRTWLRIRAAVRSSTPLEIPASVEVRSSPGLLEPGVVGLFQPLLLLPEGIIERLTPPQLDAVLAHELCHVRRRDNLTAAVHMIVEAVFWFHPLVWWIGVQLVKERERACDEDVLRLGSEPQVYAEGILSVCKFYVESPLKCVAGVTGHNLRKRVELIVRNHIGAPLTASRKFFLATAGVLTLAVPIVFGVISATPSPAESQAENTAAGVPVYDAVSVKPHASGNRNQDMKGGLDFFNATDVTLQQLIESAYGVQAGQISGAPDWLKIDRYDIEAKATRLDKSVTDSVTDEVSKLSGDLLAQRVHELVARANQSNLQTILADRFKLTVHRETKEVPFYELVIAENGPKLRESVPRDGDPHLRVIQNGRGQITGQEVPVATLARLLSEDLGRTVLDKTGLKDHYDITLQWPTTEHGEQGASDTLSAQSSEPSIFTAIQEQLGLKLEPNDMPVAFLIIDHVERPSIPNVIESLFQNPASSAPSFAASSEPSKYRLSFVQAREAMLKQELWTLRWFISKYTMEKNKAPQALDDLVSSGYMEQIPADPATLKADWIVEREPVIMMSPGEQLRRGIDGVHSSSTQKGSDGTAYSTW